MIDLLPLLLVGAAICGLIGALVAPSKGMTPMGGFLVGAPFGLLGLIWLALRETEA